LTALNNLTAQVQFFATGTTGTDFNISSTTATHTFNIPTASGTNRGALSSADWTTFNSKQNAITLTTTGSSGSSTFISNTLNIPTYTLSGLGGVPTTRTLTINGTSFDLSADRTWTISTGPTGSGTTNYISKWTSSTALGNSQIFDNGTSVGIGTASPGTKLTMFGTNPVFRVQGDGSSYYGGIDFYSSVSGSNRLNGSIGQYDANGLYIAAGTGMRLTFTTNNGTEGMRLTSAGRLLIGTTTESTYILDTNGTVRVQGGELRLDNGTTGTLNIYSATPTINFFSGGGYSFGRSSTTMTWNTGGSIALSISSNSAYTLDATNGHIWRSGLSGGTALARLTTGGNFLIGTTTSAGQKLQVSGSIYGSTLQTISAENSSLTSNPWKLGAFNSATTSLDTSGYVTVDINGTLYRLALAQEV